MEDWKVLCHKLRVVIKGRTSEANSAILSYSVVSCLNCIKENPDQGRWGIQGPQISLPHKIEVGYSVIYKSIWHKVVCSKILVPFIYWERNREFNYISFRGNGSITHIKIFCSFPLNCNYIFVLEVLFSLLLF